MSPDQRRPELPAMTPGAPLISIADGLRLDDLALCDPDLLAAAADRSEQRARQLIADGMPEDDALAHAADDALDYARRLVADHVQLQDRHAALDAVVDAYAGVPGHDYAADGVDNGAEPPGAA